MLSAEQIENNWSKHITYIKQNISEPRQSQLIEMFEKYQERMMLAPASPKKEMHSCFPGGYIYHVNNVIENSINLYKLWKSSGMLTDTFTLGELIFSAICHDLGKIGDENENYYIDNPSEWHKINQGTLYSFNEQLEFMTVPDRSLYLLNHEGIKFSKNEYIAIKIHDGLYDESNKKYLMPYGPYNHPRSALPYVLHQADLMASRIEFELQYIKPLNDKLDSIETTPLPKPKVVAPIITQLPDKFAKLLNKTR